MNIFQSDVFLQAFSKVKGDRPLLGRGMWVHEGRFFKHAFCSPWNGFADISSSDLDELAGTASMQECLMLRFTSKRMLDDSRMESLPPLPTVITFPSYEPDKKVRWAVKKSEKEGVEIRDAKMEDSYFLLESVLNERIIPLEFYKILEQAKLGRALVARHQDKTAATLFYVVDEKQIHYLYSIGADVELSKETQASMLLMSEFLKRSFGAGAPFVDLCGCSVERIYQFKKQFGSKVAFRPNYILPLNRLKWKVARKFALELYAPVPAHVPNTDSWASNLVPI